MVPNSIIKPILIISYKFKLPPDISEKIFNHIIFFSAQKIIQNWYNHISIHNTNLTYLITCLPLLHGFYDTTHVYYYDLHDINVLRTFKICLKFFSISISCIDWWSNIIHYAYTGIFFSNNFSIFNPIFQENCIIIKNFQDILLRNSKF